MVCQKTRMSSLSDAQTNIQSLSKIKLRQAHGSEIGTVRKSYLASLQTSTLLCFGRTSVKLLIHRN